MSSKNEIIQLERSRFWEENGILFCKILNTDAAHNLDDETVDSYLKAITRLCNGTKLPFLIDLRNVEGAFLPTAAKKLGASIGMSKYSLSEAFVANSLKVKLLIISFKRIYEPNTPFAIFNNYNDALNYSINAKK